MLANTGVGDWAMWQVELPRMSARSPAPTAPSAISPAWASIPPCTTTVSAAKPTSRATASRMPAQRSPHRQHLGSATWLASVSALAARRKSVGHPPSGRT